MTRLSSRFSAKAIVFGAVIGASTLASAALPTQWELDNSHTRIGFSVDHMGFSTVMGRFADAKGTVNYNMANPNQTTVNFTIPTSSIDTGWEARDEHLMSKDFFNVKQYPTMTFKSKQVQFLNPQQAKVMGDFTMLGQTKPLTLNVTLNKIANSPLTNAPVIGFRATGNIDRTAYGMDAYAAGITTNVPIQIDAELVEKKAK